MASYRFVWPRFIRPIFPSYPFWAKSGSQVSVSGTVRFENTLDNRPLEDDFVVAVTVGENDVD